MSKNGALMASGMIEELTQLVERHGDLPAMVGAGHALETPPRPRVLQAVRGKRAKTVFMCHRPLSNDFDLTPIIRLG